MFDDDSDEELVFQAEGELELQLVRSLLDRHGIPNRYQGEALRLTYGLTADGLAQVRIFVPLFHAAQARELLRALQEGALALGEEDGPPEGTPREGWKDLP
jgi:hypothetical protein